MGRRAGWSVVIAVALLLLSCAAVGGLGADLVQENGDYALNLFEAVTAVAIVSSVSATPDARPARRSRARRRANRPALTVATTWSVRSRFPFRRLRRFHRATGHGNRAAIT